MVSMAVSQIPSDFFEDGPTDKLGTLLLRLLRPKHWMAKAKCADMPLAEVDRTFFAEPSGTHPASAAIAADRARVICNGCPVRLDCLRFALSIESPGWKEERSSRGQHDRIAVKRPSAVGIYGGHTARERKAVLELPPDEQMKRLDEVWDEVRPR
jgi:Transcription factor WhiB